MYDTYELMSFYLTHETIFNFVGCMCVHLLICSYVCLCLDSYVYSYDVLKAPRASSG